MVQTRTIAALGRLFQRHPTPSDAELAAYDVDVGPALDRAERLYQDWFEHAAHLDDGERLANVAAIHRWEVGTMRRALEQVAPPPALAQPHDDLVEALAMATRAAQLLSSGRRFHNASAVCDGQILLEQSRERRLAASRKIRRLLDRRAAAAADGEHQGASPPP